MGLPAMRLEPEMPVEERIPRLESDVAHIRSDISGMKADIRSNLSEMKTDIRELRQGIVRLDQKIDDVNKDLSGRIEGVRTELSGRIDKQSEKTDALRQDVFSLGVKMEQSFARFTKWAIALYIGMAIGLLGVMARGFKWI